ncbi:IS1595 family transposase [Cohnella hashimotonis]|uniref:IS1595 family transposase n=1 Tax=Cohnella hashimotonis TaxID=2826895 RepID=A0ABT6TIW8_9BACL|nr:IS1595 family transposase [Cohnella hashimotonis]MDI4646766.1 IS1595 family transposase [Cohnella hashimotonis]
MVDAPMTNDEFLAAFGTEQACADALFNARWPDGFSCSACGGARYYEISTRRLPLYECASCRLQTSLIVGTVMEGSRTSLTRWFHAIYLLSRTDGISALRLSSLILVTYKTAWLMAHKIRNAMSEADASVLLTGNVRIDRCYYGDPTFDDARQPLLIGAAFNDEASPAYIKIKQPHPSHVYENNRFIKPEGVQAFHEEHTDCSSKPEIYGYRKNNPALSLVARQFNAWLNLTFNGIGAKHLQRYLNEFAFRLNCSYREVHVFRETLAWCANSPVVTYPQLIAYKPMLQVPWLVFGSKARWRGAHLSRWGA